MPGPLNPEIQSQTRPARISSAALAPLAAVLIYSGNAIVTKAAATAIDPASIAFYRWLFALVVLTPFVGPSVWRQRSVVLRYWPKLALLGVLGMATYQGLAYEAARTTTAVNMGVMLALIPLLSALLANAFAGERLSLRRLLGAVVSLVGVLILMTHGAPSMLLQGAVRIGDVLMLMAVSANALYGVLVKRWALPLTTWQQLHVQIGFGTLILLPFWLAGPMTPLSAANIPLVLYAAILASMCAPFFWMTGIKHLGPSRTALFMNLLPPMVALMAWLILDEQLHLYHAIGAVLALLGVGIGLQQAAVAKSSA
jgi:drug/metabolite transporter (DMT)-like permease